MLLQTIIVTKTVAKTLREAKKIAKKYGRRLPTVRRTATSFRFRQQPPEDFEPGSFRTRRINAGVSLVYGRLR